MRLVVRRGSGELESILQWQSGRQGRGMRAVAQDASDDDDEILVCETRPDNVGTDDPGAFCPDSYFAHLAVRGLRAAGRRLVYLPRVESTQSLLQERFPGWDGWRLAAVRPVAGCMVHGWARRRVLRPRRSCAFDE